MLLCIFGLLTYHANSQTFKVKLLPEATYFTKIDSLPTMFDKSIDTIVVHDPIRIGDNQWWQSRIKNTPILVKGFNFEETGLYKEYLLRLNKQLTEHYKSTLLKKFGKENASLIFEKKVRVGITKNVAIASWGEPSEIHKTILKGYVSEQWVYDGSYLYFTNGILTGIQN